MRLAEFNALPPERASDVVGVWAAIPSWVEAIVAARPYGSVDDLAAAAARAATTWTHADLDAALAHHPRIGEKPSGGNADAAASRREQASMSAADDDTAARITAGNAAYEQRFGRVFLIRAAGRSPREMLSELERRQANPPDAEADEALGQLAEIAVLRLHQTLAEDTA